MKTITRGEAIQMYAQLGNLPLGQLDDATLSTTIDNFDKLRKVQEDYQSLALELRKRLYEGKEEHRTEGFFELVMKYESETDAEKKKAYRKEMAEGTYKDFCPIYDRHLALLDKLFNKEVEIELEKVDKKAFMKGLAKELKGLNLHSVLESFAPMFCEEQTAPDLSELDGLLK